MITNHPGSPIRPQQLAIGLLSTILVDRRAHILVRDPVFRGRHCRRTSASSISRPTLANPNPGPWGRPSQGGRPLRRPCRQPQKAMTFERKSRVWSPQLLRITHKRPLLFSSHRWSGRRTSPRPRCLDPTSSSRGAPRHDAHGVEAYARISPEIQSNHVPCPFSGGSIVSSKTSADHVPFLSITEV